MKQISVIFSALVIIILGISNAWALPNCPSSGYFHNCFGTYTWESGNKYVGEWQNNKRNGQGTYTWANGDKYIGEQRNDKREGQGTYTWADGEIYVGEWRNDKKNGKGTTTYIYGDQYIGEYKNDKKDGQGTYIYADGYKEVGTFENGKLNGYAIKYFADGSVNKEGIFKDDEFLYAQSKTLPACPTSGYFHNCFGSITYKSGDIYSGEFKNDKLDGQGTYTFGPNSQWAGDEYIGEFKVGGFTGQGTYTFADGEKYVGEYKNGKRDGQGINSYANGEKYVGEYKDGKQNGQGTYTFSNGDKYVGAYKNDKRDGLGTYTWVTGETYVGAYKNGKQNGQGTYTYSNGDKYVGEFKDGEFNGQGIFTYGANTKWAGHNYVGEFKNDKRNGQGTYTFANGRKEVGEFKNDALNGYAITYFANGTIDQQGIFKNNKFQYYKASGLPDCVGSWSANWKNCYGSYEWENGSKYVGDWQDSNTRTGQGTYTWPNGDRYVGGYKNNMLDGEGTYIYGSTTKWAGDKYVGGFKEGERSGHGSYIYSNGDTYVGEYKNGQHDGQGTYTFKSGAKDIGTWENGKLNGYAIKYFANGTINQEGIFKDDKFLYAEGSSPNILKKEDQSEKVINASSGSGFAVSPDGYVITNNHVIEGCQEVIVHTKEKDIKTRIISFDPQNDLALLKGDFRPKTVFPLSNNRPELLQDIYVAGYPFGNAISSSIKVTKGIISSLTGIGNNFSNIQIDAALQSGNSGGPIIDDNGNVIAVAVSKLDAKYMLENFGSIPENTNFGIKSSVVKSILDSNNVARPEANQSGISKTKLGKMISSGTYYISCWMTQAQIELLKSKKVLFEDLN